MRQLITSRRVLLPALLLFTAILILASRDRGVTIDFKGTALYHASPIDAVIETIPVSFHGQLRKGIYTGSCDEIRLWTEYAVKNDRIFTTYDPLIHPVITITE